MINYYLVITKSKFNGSINFRIYHTSKSLILWRCSQELTHSTLLAIVGYGDCVYQVTNGLSIRKSIKEWKILSIYLRQTDPNDFIISVQQVLGHCRREFFGSQLGEDLFLTRKEAQKKLQELKEKQ